MKKFMFIGAVSLALAGALNAASWGYGSKNGPAHWGDIDPSFEECKLGHAQSPINISTKETSATENNLKVSYKDGSNNIENNGHTIQVNFDIEDSRGINFEGRNYNLVQVHFHTPSENHIDGKMYPLEAHLVHKSKGGKLLVIGILFENGKENQVLGEVLKVAPKAAHKKDDFTALNAKDLLPQDLSYYSFEGSLTTPPCSEGVQWVVLKEKLSASKKQVKDFNKLMKDNARGVQALNQRQIKEVK